MAASIEDALASVRRAMPILGRTFGQDEVRKSVERVIGKHVDPDGPARGLVLASMVGDLDDVGLRLLIEVAEDIKERLL